MTKYIVTFALCCGCATETALTEPIAETALAICQDDPFTPEECVRNGPEAYLIRDVPGADAWLTASPVCHAGAEIWLCKSSAPVPPNCIWVDGYRPAGFNPLCCAIDGTWPPATCKHTSPPHPAPDCPTPLADCYQAWCGPAKKCMFTTYWDNGGPCGAPGNVCAMQTADGPVMCGPPIEE